MKLTTISTIFLFAACGSAAAQESRWALGVGTAVSSSVYAGEDTRITPFPLVSYEGERFFWRGISGGAHLVKRPGFTLDATLSARMDGVDRDDFGEAELRARGIDRALLADRDNAPDLGLAAGWRGSAGSLELEVKGDVSGASKGYEAGVKYAYPMQWGRTRIAPSVSVSHLSKKLANYYYGTLPEEAARGVRNYQPGSAVVPRIGVDVVHPFAGRWAVIANVSYRKLPGKLKDSPLVEQDKDGVTLGLLRRLARFLSRPGRVMRYWPDFFTKTNGRHDGQAALEHPHHRGQRRTGGEYLRLPGSLRPPPGRRA